MGHAYANVALYPSLLGDSHHYPTPYGDAYIHAHGQWNQNALPRNDHDGVDGHHNLKHTKALSIKTSCFSSHNESNSSYPYPLPFVRPYVHHITYHHLQDIPLGGLTCHNQNHSVYPLPAYCNLETSHLL